VSLHVETREPEGIFQDQSTWSAQVETSLQEAPITIKKEEEGSLILAAKAGDLSAFNCLVLANQDRLYWWIASMIRDETLAEDLTQLVFITAFRKLDTFHGGSFSAWLFAIARNRCLDEIRRSRRHPLLSLDGEMKDEESGDEYDLISVIPGNDPLPEETVIQSEQAENLYRLLAMLPEPFRLAIELVDLHDMDYSEAAEVLHLPLGTVKSRVTRARRKLRELLS
jgi:RNA polymerase sigma-70 factor, ECF subfamily